LEEEAIDEYLNIYKDASMHILLANNEIFSMVTDVVLIACDSGLVLLWKYFHSSLAIILFAVQCFRNIWTLAIRARFTY
jgi:hypothetical protein